MPHINVGPLDLYYEIRGSGPRLFFISGTGGDLRRHPNIFDSPLADQFEILAYDQRGLGQSARPDVDYTMIDYANDADALLRHLDWDPCAVLGISFGGTVAQEFALRFPHRISRLVLACTSAGGAGGHSYPLQNLSHLSPREWASMILTLSDTRRDAEWRKLNAQLFDQLVEQVLESQSIGANEPGREMGARRQIEARKGHDTYARLPAVEFPVFVCGGKFDGIAPKENLDALAKQIIGAKLELFDGGHMFYLQDSRAFDRIADFYNGAV
ncbi:MAG: alpha/beta hydrolase [Gammaproteobacteria bacterium]